MRTAFGPSCERGFQQAGDLIPAPVFARPDDVWTATLRCVDDHRRLPRTLIHSDVHLKNWYIDGDGELGLSDWQCSSKGNWSRDVSYALATALSIDDRRAWERDLLSYYLEQLHTAGAPTPDLDDAWRLYRRQLFAALAWWTGTLGQPRKGSQMQPQDTSREFIRRITAAIDDLDALSAWN
jgi:Ser/Thr protein kinase RdoA (MazF antagonist)